jgi:two-component system, OmpR family, sensor histidine kinase CreC
MHIGLRIFFGFFLIVGLAAFLTLHVFVQEVKPGMREAMEDTLVDTAQVLAVLAADDLKRGHIADGAFAQRLGQLRDIKVNANVWGLKKDSIDYRIYVTDAQGIVRFDSAGAAVGQDYSRWNDVYLTLRGGYGARSTLSNPADENSTVMHVAAPVRDGQRIIGVLSIAKPNVTMAPFIERSQRKILLYGLLLMGTAAVVGIACTGWLVVGLRKLQRYARAIAAGERIDMPFQGAGELAELGRAVKGMHERLENKQYVEQYIHTLAHEMKSPLAAISGSAELLQQTMPAVDHDRFRENVLRQAERLEQMIRKLLALADVEQRQSLAESEPVALAPLLEQLLRELEPRARQRQLALQLRTAQLRPSTDGQSSASSTEPASPVVQGDRFLLRQALTNLLENALDFAPAGSAIDIVLDDRSAQMPGTVAIHVIDRGPGVPDYAMPRLFERFYSLPRPGGRDKSTGLGLCFVREVALLHQGKIVLVNQPDGGTCATLTVSSRLHIRHTNASRRLPK